MDKNPGSCPTCGKKVRHTKDVIVCGKCHRPVHIQCLEERSCLCFPCLENLGNSAKAFPVDSSIRELVMRKRKSIGL